MTLDEDRLEAFTLAYIGAALWSSRCEEGGDCEFLDAKYDVEDFDAESLASMKNTCRGFFERFKHYIAPEYIIDQSYWPETHAGIDFWLTRNHHGTGFWDNRWKEPAATEMTNTAEAYGECYLYVENGKIYMEA